MGKISINQDSLKDRRDWKRFKLQDGDNVYRILPPFGDVEIHKNYPYRKWSTVWMLDPKTGRKRPFATPATEGEKCPITEYVNKLSEFVEERKKDLKDQGHSDEKIKKHLAKVNDLLWKMKVSHIYAYNAANQAGEVGILEVKSTAHKGLKKCMNAYIKEYAQDPTSLNSDLEDDAGVWFNITKEGSGKDTTYEVKNNQIRKKIGGEIVKVDDRQPLAQNIVENYEDLAYDLNAVYVRKDYKEMNDILLYNLAILAEDIPECVLPGYDVLEIDTSVQKEKEDDVIDDEDDEEILEEAPKKAATAASKVKLNLDDIDDLEEDYVDEAPAKVKVAASSKVSKTAPKKSNSVSTQDFIAMADDILGD